MALVSGGHLPPVDRAAAGRALGWIGDERPGVGVVDGLPDIVWCEVEEGPFVMGSDKRVETMGTVTSSRNSRVVSSTNRIASVATKLRMLNTKRLSKPMAIETSNTGRRHGWRWRQSEDADSPRDFGPLFQAPNHPRVGVSWYEAVAYCSWLSERLGYTVRLPSEAEWERAARSTDGRIYPWGDEFDARRCNMSDTGIGATSTVGIFPDGDSVCGAADMSGNVWEWCSTKWLGSYKDYEAQADNTPDGDDRRVLRGGAFFNVQFDVRCASRLGYSPDGRGNLDGIRLCAPGL